MTDMAGIDREQVEGVRRGYDIDQVDEFLVRQAEAWRERLHEAERRIVELENDAIELRQLGSEVEAARRQQEALTLTFQTAAQAQDEMLAKAEREAAERQLAQGIDTGDWLRAVESRLVEATMRAIERVIGEMDNVVLTRRIARAALRDIRGVGAVALHVAPATAEQVRDEIELVMAPFAGALGGMEIVEVVGDETVSPGGAVLKSAAGVVDARLETQMKALRGALETAFESRSLNDADDGEPESGASSAA